MIGSLERAPEAAVQAALAQVTAKTAGRDLARQGTLAQLGVLTAFWIYVTVSNVLYAHNMALTFDPGGPLPPAPAALPRPAAVCGAVDAHRLASLAATRTAAGRAGAGVRAAGIA